MSGKKMVVRMLVGALGLMVIAGCGSDDAGGDNQGWNVGANDQPNANDSPNANDPTNVNDPTNANDPSNANDPTNANDRRNANDKNDPSEAPIVDVVVEPSSLVLAVGEEIHLEVVAFDDDGQQVEVDDEDIEWVSDDESVVTVDGVGEVTGKSFGEASVTATVDELSAQAQITVEESTWRDIVAGSHVSCAVSWDGELYCWGTDQFGVSADQDFAQPMHSEPVEVSVPISVAGVTIGYTHYCAWDDSGETYCWGFNGEGQLGASPSEQVRTPMPIAGKSFVTVNAGVQHTCGVTEDGDIFCWGTNEYGELGTTEMERSSDPVKVDIDAEMVDVAAGFHHSCGVDEGGDVHCWGRNFAGAIDPWTPVDEVLAPTEVPLLEQAVSVEVGGLSTCVLTASGAVMCWGFNSDGQMGRDIAIEQLAFPDYVDSAESFVDMSTLMHTVCGVTEAGEMKCWGNNRFGTVGDGSGDDRHTPVVVDGAWEATSVGQTQACGISGDDEILCWGGNALGEAGDGRAMREYSLEPVAGEERHFDELVTGGHVVCGIDRQQQQTFCWGRNESGQHQQDRPGTFSAPTALPAWSPMSLALGDGFGCGMESDDGAAETLKCWGVNHEGQLGINVFSVNASETPLPVDSLQEFTAFDLGSSHGCAVADGGQMYCWGSNVYRQAGAGQGTLYEDEPVEVVIDGDDFVDVTAGNVHSCGLTSNGDIWCWGGNEFGQLGRGETSGQEGPAKVVYDEAFVAIEAAAFHTCGLTDDNDVICWGNGTFLTGNPETVFAENPRVFAGGWESIAVGDHRVCAIADETLHCAGWDIDGWLGSPTPMTVNYLAPVDDDVAVSEVAVEAGYLCILDDAGEAMCRGGDAFGVLGRDSNVIYREPNAVAMP